MKYCIDRIEGHIAVCEDNNGNIINIPLDELPCGIEEGSIVENDGMVYRNCEDDTLIRRKEMSSLQNSIFSDKEKK